jgi:hypothetical protein
MCIHITLPVVVPRSPVYHAVKQMDCSGYVCSDQSIRRKTRIDQTTREAKPRDDVGICGIDAARTEQICARNREPLDQVSSLTACQGPSAYFSSESVVMPSTLSSSTSPITRQTSRRASLRLIRVIATNPRREVPDQLRLTQLIAPGNGNVAPPVDYDFTQLFQD